MEDKNLKCIQNEIDFFIEKRKTQDSLWSKRLVSWVNRIIDKNGQLKISEINNFRKYSIFLSETPHSKKNLFLNHVHKLIRGKGHFISAFHSLENYKKSSDQKYLTNIKMSVVGNPGYYVTNKGIKFNERYLRHLRNIENIEKYIINNNSNEVKNVLDIGGGYSQFLEMMKRRFDKLKFANVDFYEQLILAYYYLLENFPESKICPMSKILSCEYIDETLINKFDFILIPIECYHKIKPNVFDLITNFSSFGEMPRNVFLEYLNSPQFKSAKFVYTVNRLDSFPTYNNNISLIDYLEGNLNISYLSVSPIWKHYFVSKMPFLKPTKKPYNSRNFELILKNGNR